MILQNALNVQKKIAKFVQVQNIIIYAKIVTQVIFSKIPHVK